MPERAEKAVTAAAVAAVCGGKLVGDPELPLFAVRALHAAGPSDLSFAADTADERKALASGAGAILVKSAAAFGGRTVVEVASPGLALVDALRLFHPPRVARAGVHPTAVVDGGAVLDPSAELGPYVVVGEGASIGPGCILEAHVVVGRGCRLEAGVRLHPHVVLYDDVMLGRGVEVHSGAVLGADGFGYAPSPRGLVKVPQVGNVVIEEGAEIGANTCVDRASLETTRIGAGTKLDDLVMIGHNSTIGRHTLICAQTGLAGSTDVGDGVVIAGQVGVKGHLRIGDGAKVGAQAGVSTDLAPGEEVWGSPHLSYRDYVKSYVEFRKLPETARMVRRLAKDAGLKDGER